MADNLGSTWEDKLLLWSENVKQDYDLEGQIQEEINNLREEGGLIQDDVLASVYNMFCLADAEARLAKHRSTMHPGFYFVGDNVDMRTNVRQMILSSQSKDQHMFQICAYKHRINGNHLDNSKPNDSIETVPFRLLVPCETDAKSLIEEFTYLVAQQWTELKPVFQPYKKGLPNHIEHRYMKQTCQKTERVRFFFSS